MWEVCSWFDVHVRAQPEDPPVPNPAEDHVAEDPVDVPSRYPEWGRHRPDYF